MCFCVGMGGGVSVDLCRWEIFVENSSICLHAQYSKEKKFGTGHYKLPSSP